MIKPPLVSSVSSETNESQNGGNLFARVYTSERAYEVSKLRRLSRRTTDAMRQEAHDYRLALGSFAAGASARQLQQTRESCPQSRRVPISKGAR